ncbi:hypothetical protein L1987_46632 [Smallanthus sonchifolius]|uniref:Uncharacterized protein n=1 Tax=Smallanthus sonchifolius TaxID=185202 RepID=A0ACB9G0A2_9ASTR|nr:hypothetical protein L1987_46632 [Smallanthus sonchifolius]
MAEGSSLKLIIEKGPRAGETLTYSPGSLVKVGRVVRGNTIAIKDAGISSKHICFQFDNEISKWTLCDLDSSNGTILNGQILKPYAPSGLEDGDCIKIGELTSIIVKIGVESPIKLRRNPRRQGKPGAGPAAVVEKGVSELGLGFDEDLGRNEVNEPVGKRNLRSRAKKAVDSKNEVESLSSRRILRSSKKEEVSFIPKLNQISEILNVDAVEVTDYPVSLEPKKTRGRKKIPVQPPEDPDIDERKPAEVVPKGKRTNRRGRKGLQVEPLENAQSSGLEEKLNNPSGSSQVDEGNGARFDKFTGDPLEIVKDSGLGENLYTNNESAQEHVVEPQKDCEGKEVMVDESSLQGKEVAEESEYRKDGCEGIVKDTGPDDGQWLDLEKMTLSDFFDYLEMQLPKEIYDKSEKIISELKEKARKCHEFRVQRNENGKGKLVID